MTTQGGDAAEAIANGTTSLGIELGSTNIKACLIGPDHEVLATGTHTWENQFVDRLWTYSEDAIWTGLQEAYAALVANVRERHGVDLTRIGALGLSAMMHGYLAFDADGRLLAFAEGAQEDGSGTVWLRTPAGEWQDLTLRAGSLFRPTGAALLPSGDVLLLERRYTLLGGLGARVSRIAAATIRPGARLAPKTLAELAPPLTLDNFEGIAAHRAADGTTRITLLSDDNFNAFQRTLLVQFELLEN